MGAGIFDAAVLGTTSGARSGGGCTDVGGKTDGGQAVITHRALAERFKAGASIESLAKYVFERDRAARFPTLQWAEHYVEHALRQAMKEQHRRHYGD